MRLSARGLVAAEVEDADLGICGKSRALVVRQSLVTGIFCAAACGAALAVVDAFVVSLGTAAVAIAAACAGAAGYLHPVRQLRRVAALRRADFDLAVAVLLDLVNIQTAGGAGIETALVASVSLGDGWAFESLRRTVAAAQSSRRSYWDALIDLGAAWGITSLVEVGHSARLSGEHGARVRQSLISKAASLRARNLARVEFEAQQRTEQMGLPMVVLFVSFLVFVGYPPLAQTMGAF